RKVEVIQPPVIMPSVSSDAVEAFMMDHHLDNSQPVIGMASRFASEKGIGVLLESLEIVKEKFPQFKVLFAGTYKNVMGEEAYFERLYPTIEQYEKTGQWEFLGNLAPEQMAAFYPNLDMVVVPSLNSTESFGLVQIEAMIHGTPSIASDLPGVRQPVLQHQMGKVVPIGDAKALADAIIDIAKNKQAYIKDPQPIAEFYDPQTVARRYEQLFERLLQEIR
ncbi:MAG TPA: glycosyltransferase, partial [Chloroflexi bacterium]|nr:glycosyltransferase [Chloroflexota bacterium]